MAHDSFEGGSDLRPQCTGAAAQYVLATDYCLRFAAVDQRCRPAPRRLPHSGLPRRGGFPRTSASSARRQANGAATPLRPRRHRFAPTGDAQRRVALVCGLFFGCCRRLRLSGGFPDDVFLQDIQKSRHFRQMGLECVEGGRGLLAELVDAAYQSSLRERL